MLYYIIPTSLKYKDIVLPKLLNSLKNSQNQIIVAVNESNDKKIVEENNIIYYYLNTCAFEYLAPIVALKLLNKSDHFFWLHDTCEAGPNFENIINQYDYTKYDYVDVYNGYCNFGIYSVELIIQDSNWVLSQRNITKEKAVTNEMRYFREFKNCKQNRFLTIADVDCYKQIGVKDVYNTGTPRLVEHYGHIDLYKFKANWYYKKDWTIKV